MSLTGATPQPPAKTLVVDDDHDQVSLLTRFLSRRGIVAISAYSGRGCRSSALRADRCDRA
jgi:DNA-binding response OmpR family regulator